MNKGNSPDFQAYYAIPLQTVVFYFLNDQTSFEKESNCLSEIIAISKQSQKIKGLLVQYLDDKLLADKHFEQFMYN